MSRVIHFEIAADNPEKSAAFYTDVFDWTIQKWDGPEEYWLVTTGENGTPGIDGGLMRAQSHLPPTVNTIEVASVDAYVEKITAHGGAVAVPKTAVPGVGYFAYCKDPAGVVFGIMEPDETAQPSA